jgi:hypothetical protein
MFEAADKDHSFRSQLLANPRDVAKEWGVELDDREVERLIKLNAFLELADEIKWGRLYRFCDPRVCYPSTVWLQDDVIDIIRILGPKPIPGYPPPDLFERRIDRVSGGFNVVTRARR